jgi:hypothetical protein
MMPQDTRQLLEVLERLQSHYPHWRFGQLVSNVAAWAGEDRPGEVAQVTDEELLRAARAHLARLGNQGGPQRAAV